jgi:amidase
MTSRQHGSANADSLTEINFEEALAEAERLDKHMKETGKVVGPLHGIPFSVKV